MKKGLRLICLAALLFFLTQSVLYGGKKRRNRYNKRLPTPPTYILPYPYVDMQYIC